MQRCARSDAVGRGGPSHATLSRLLNCLSSDANIDSVHEGLLRLTSLNGGRRPQRLPIEVFGHQGGSAYDGYAKSHIYSPLVASLAETGDMVGSLLREGNAGPAEDADTWIPHLVQRLSEGMSLDVAQIQVRLDAGFTDGETLMAMDSRDISYLGG